MNLQAALKAVWHFCKWAVLELSGEPAISLLGTQLRNKKNMPAQKHIHKNMLTVALAVDFICCIQKESQYTFKMFFNSLRSPD